MMETIKKSTYGKNKVGNILIILILSIAMMGCSKSDDGTVTSINAKTQTFILNGINNCNTSSGSGSTIICDIPYTADTASKISKLLIKTTVSSGDSKNAVNTKFTDENNIISWASCFRFGSQNWVEYEVVLEAQDGTKSNPSKVRVNKPVGAN